MKRRSCLAGAVTLMALGAAATPAHAAGPNGIMAYWKDVSQWFLEGGNTMWFILATAILGLAFVIERAVRMRRSRVVPRELADQVRAMWNQGRYGDINTLCEADDSTLAHAVKVMVRHRDVPMSDVRQIVGDSISAELGLFHRRIHPIAVAATVAPLLGLFGTVSGMISAFRHFNALRETGDPTVFAGDISIALITTEAGLMVAIPALTAWHYYRNRTTTFVDEMESIIQELLVAWFLKRPEPAVRSEAAVAVN